MVRGRVGPREAACRSWTNHQRCSPPRAPHHQGHGPAPGTTAHREAAAVCPCGDLLPADLQVRFARQVSQHLVRDSNFPSWVVRTTRVGVSNGRRKGAAPMSCAREQRNREDCWDPHGHLLRLLQSIGLGHGDHPSGARFAAGHPAQVVHAAVTRLADQASVGVSAVHFLIPAVVQAGEIVGIAAVAPSAPTTLAPLPPLLGEGSLAKQDALQDARRRLVDRLERLRLRLFQPREP